MPLTIIAYVSCQRAARADFDAEDQEQPFGCCVDLNRYPIDRESGPSANRALLLPHFR